MAFPANRPQDAGSAGLTFWVGMCVCFGSGCLEPGGIKLQESRGQDSL